MTFKELAKPWIANLGVYEPGRPIEEVARELGFKDADAIIKLASNENALGPSPKAVLAMKKAARQMHLYPDGGAFYLGQALAKRLNVTPDQIIVGCGSNELLEFIGHVFLQKGTSIVMADRAFVVYKLIAAMFQAETISVPMVDYRHDLNAMLKAIRPDTRVVFVANPNNPTGTMVSGAEIDAFMRRVPEHVVVVFDEAYVELLPTDRQPDVLKYVRDGRKVVIMRTFSKTYGLAGLRIGYGVAPAECIQLMHRIRQPFNTTAMGQIAAVAALDDDAHVERTRTMMRDGLAFLQDAFKSLGLPYVPSSANFILVQVGQGRRVFEALQPEGIIARPMDGYGLPEHIRITVGTKAENRRFLAALKKVLGRTKARG